MRHGFCYLKLINFVVMNTKDIAPLFNRLAKNRDNGFRTWLVCLLTFGMFSAATLSNVSAQKSSNEKYPWIASEKNTAGLYGLADGNGGWTVEPEFEFLGNFCKGSPVTSAKYKGKNYVVDRSFNIVGGPYQYVAAAHPCFAVVEESYFNVCCINTKGQKITGAYEIIKDVNTLHEDIHDLMVFAKRKGSALWDILGADGKSICGFAVNNGGNARGLTCDIDNVFVDNNFEKDGKLIAPLIKFPDNGKYGIMNLAGETVVPAKYSRIDNIDLNDFYNITKYSGAKCTEGQLRRHTFFVCYDAGNAVTLVDATGKVVVPVQKDFKNANAYFRKNKKELAQYLLQSDGYDRDLKAKVLAPYQAFLDRMQKYIDDNGLMNPVGNGNNLLAIVRNDKAEAQRLLAAQQTKERAARTAVAAKRTASSATRVASNRNPKAATQKNPSYSVPLPAYGQLPYQGTDLYYGKKNGGGEACLHVAGMPNGGCYVSLKSFNINWFTQDLSAESITEDGDYIVLGGHKKFYSTTYTMTGPVMKATDMEIATIKVAKDWSHIVYIPRNGKPETFDNPIPKELYEQHYANLNAYNAKNKLFEYSPEYQKSEAAHNQRVKEIMRQDDNGGQTTARTSTTRKNGNSKVDVRVDETNMTGKDQGYKWCEQCKKWDIPHVHVKK